MIFQEEKPTPYIRWVFDALSDHAKVGYVLYYLNFHHFFRPLN